MKFILQTGGLTYRELNIFLTICSHQYPLLLNKKLNIKDYTEKLIANASFVYLKQEKEIFGLVAFYDNDCNLDYAFISLICVLEGYTNKGIGRRLIDDCVSCVKEKGFRSIKLEADINNRNAINFYMNCGFQVEEEKHNSFIMRKLLN